MKKVVFMLATLSSLSFAAVAGTPKGETKDVKSETTTEAPPEVKWFRFEGEVGEENDPTQYVVITSPSCTSGTHRCEIRTETQSGNPNQPNLSITPLEERRKN